MSFLGDIGEIVDTGRNGVELSFEWKIPDFSTLYGEGGDSYESPAFSVCDTAWYFKMYPNRMDRNSPAGWVDLFLLRADGGPPQTVGITVGIKGADGVECKKERKQEFSEDDDACCWNKFCKLSELSEPESRLTPGDVLTLTCEVENVGPSASAVRDAPVHTDEVQSEILAEESHPSEQRGVEELQSSLLSLLRSEEDCDVVVKVQGKEFKAHRLILRARSPVFRAMFSHDMLERQRGVVTMEDCSPETFPDLLEHIYTGSVGMISAKNVFGLYSASDKYDLKTLKKECTQFMRENMAAASFCDTIALAVQHGEGDLIERATEFFCRHSLDIVQTVEWQKFLAENTTVGNELLIKLLSKHESIFRNTT